MPDILKVSALHARSFNAFLHRLPSLNTASVAKQRFYVKRLFLGYRYFDIFLRFGLDRVLKNTGWVGTIRLTGRAGSERGGPKNFGLFSAPFSKLTQTRQL
jgi:hypothetical protein